MPDVNGTDGNKADILTPLTNQIVRSDGALLTNFTFAWTGDASDASDNAGASDRKLMDRIRPHLRGEAGGTDAE